MIWYVTGIIITDNDKMPIQFKASEREEKLFITDINVKERITKMKQAEALKRSQLIAQKQNKTTKKKVISKTVISGQKKRVREVQ